MVSEMKDKWEELIRSDMLPHNISIAMMSIPFSNKMIGGPRYEKLHVYIKDGIGYYYENFSDHQLVGEHCIRHYSNSKNLLKFYKNWVKKRIELNTLCDKIETKDLKKSSEKEITTLIKSLFEKGTEWHGGVYNVDAVDVVLNPLIENVIRQKYPSLKKSEISEIYNKITFPTELTYMTRQRIEQLEIFKAMHEKKDCKTKIRKFINEFYWKDYALAKSSKYTEESLKTDFKSTTKESVHQELSAMNARIAANLEEKKRLMKEITKSFPAMKNYSEIFERYAQLHDFRKEGQVKYFQNMTRLYDEVAKRKKIDQKLLYCLWPNELLNAIESDTKIDSAKLKKRNSGVLFTFTADNKLEETYGEDAILKRNEIIGRSGEKITELSGIGASQGRIVGRARLSLSAKEAIEKIQEGEILVTGMTMPEFVPAMKKAAAVITDEGGLTCHAAIICRELGIPCIVGTEMATRSIKNGDFLEVNANHGVVKIISEKEHEALLNTFKTTEKKPKKEETKSEQIKTSSSTKLLTWFKELGKHDANIAGGKGASLGEMTSAGIPVPNGFVVTANAFERFLEETDLDVELDAILKKVNIQEMQSIENASEEIQALIMEKDVPKDLGIEIERDFKTLDSEFVAVRSSATAEDSSAAAWAGQLDSFLNTTKKTLLLNVKKCWASLFTPRAIFYRFEKGLHTQKISVAVVIQKMVQSEISGIAFSVHPVTQDRNQLIIEAGFGLGEAIVSGQITPDSYVATKNPRLILDKNISNQERGLFKIPTGGSEWKSTTERGNEQKLTDKQILELSEIVLRIENHYHFPCDIEWAFEKGKFYIVQSRPITTLTDKTGDSEMPTATEEKKKNEEKGIIVDKKNNILLKEGKPDLSKHKLSKIIRRTNSPLFNSFMRVGATIPNPELEFDSRMLIHIVLDHDIYYSEQEFEDLKKRMTEKAKKDDAFLDRYLKKSLSDSLELIEWAKQQNDSKNLLKTYNEFTDKALKVMSHLWPCLGPEEWILAEIEKSLAKKIDPKKDFNEYKRVLTLLTASTEISEITLRKMGMLEGKNIQEVQEKYAWILDQGLYFDYETLDAFKKELAQTQDPKTELARIINEQKQLISDREKAIKKFGLDKKTLALCELAQRLPHIRLIRRDCLIKAAYYMKDFFKRMQKELSLSKISHAYYWELRDLLEGKDVDLAKIEERKETYSFIVNDNSFYEYDKETGIAIKKEIESTLDLSGEIKGQTACIGKVTGTARVLFSSKEIGRVAKGEILVTSMTMPDFVPAMERAAAIVTDEGGLSCHAAIVAREMKKPCVIGTKTATKKIKDGDVIEVNATDGIVRIISSSAGNDKKDDIDWAKDFLKNSSFDLKEAKCSLLVGDILFKEYAKKNCFGESYSPLFIPYANMVLAQVIPEERMKNLERKSWEVFANERKRFEKAIYEANAIQEDIDSIALDPEKLSRLSDKKLLDYFSELEDRIRKWWKYGSVGEEKGLIVEERIVPSLMKNHSLSPDEAREYVMTFTMPEEQSIFSKERDAFLDLCIDQCKRKSNRKKIEDYSKKYFYSRSDFYEGKTLDKEGLGKIITAHCKSTPLEKIKEEKKHIAQNYEKLLDDKKKVGKKLTLLAGEERDLEYFSALQVWLDERKLSMLKHFYYVFKLAEEVSKRKKIGYETISLMSTGEVKEIIAGKKLDLEKIRTRENGTFAIYRENEEALFFSGSEAQELRQLVYGSGDTTGTLTGTVASKGKQSEKIITGKIRVIFDPSKDTLKEGEILVTSMTRPEFVPIMKKALAIITDEGGIACHAAIVSRELGIPCIIGTKNATKMLKDGDKVEVNSNAGTVKIISSNNAKQMVIEGINALKWEKWLERPFFAFTLSLSEDSFSLENTRRLGMKGIALDAMLFQKGSWYFNQEVFDRMDEEIEKYLDKNKMQGITGTLKEFKMKSEKTITELPKKNITIESKFEEVFNILSTAMAFVWLAHGIESYYNKRLKEEVPKYVKNDVDKFIGDASFPKKKNLNTMLDEMLRSKKSDKEVAEIAGWTKVRDGFAKPYTPEDIAKLRKELPAINNHEEVEIPKQLKPLFEQIQELVFYRTERTDVFYYLYFKARPILQEMAKKHDIEFEDMIYYRAKSFLTENPERYSKSVSFALFKGETVFQDTPMIEEKATSGGEVKGTVAFKGKAIGTVKIVKDINQLDKVKQGDILVTQMTFPSFIPAMIRASAFVTDEGGITCHAAIVAREMKKPCIIGTKNATRVLKDGDTVEVDADNGIVRIISKNDFSSGDKNKELQQPEKELGKIITYLQSRDILPEGGRACYFYPHYLIGRIYFDKDLKWAPGFGGIRIVSIMKNNIAEWYYHSSNGKEFELALEKTLKNPSTLKNIEKFLENESTQAVKKISKLNLNKLSNKQLAELATYYYKEFEEILAVSGHIRMNDRAISKRVKSKDILAEKQSALYNEEKALSNLAKKARQGLQKKQINTELNKIYEKYCFTSLGYFNEKPKTKEHYKSLLEALIKNSHPPKNTINGKIPKTRFEKIASKIIYLKDLFKYSINKLEHNYEPMFAEISKRTNKEVGFIKNLLPEETTSLVLKKEIDLKGVEKRAEKSIMITTDSKAEILLDNVDEIIKEIFKPPEEIMGKVASKGYAKGIARIITSQKEFKKFQTGDVIIAYNTSPDYFPLMKNASAIVAEDGSLTCHAAIVSRELKVPCIIGAYGATKILKDGDVVEVDANKGTVKIISKNIAQTNDKKEDDLTAQIWNESFRWRYEAYPFFTSVYLKAYAPPRTNYHFQWKHFLNKFRDGELVAYLPRDPLLQKGQEQIEELLEGKKGFAREFGTEHKRLREAIAMIEKQGNKGGLDNWWPKTQIALSEASALLFSFDFALNERLKEMQSNDPKLFDTINSNIIEEDKSFLNEAVEYLQKLAKRHPQDFQKIHSEFMKKYSWFQNSYKGEFPITEKWLKEFYEKNKSARPHKKSAKKPIKKKYRLLTKIASQAINVRDDKKKLLLRAVEHLQGWLKKECATKGMKFEELRWLSVDEAKAALSGDKEMINLAKECEKNNERFGTATTAGYAEVTRELFEEVSKQFLKNEGASEIRGMTGNKGKVTGIARIIHDAKKEENRLNEGEILVTSMTRPEFMPLMNKAAGFVTDEGGVTCHAAIIAREMNKPCVISTKIATQVIKDGDTIEVDADKGIVIILDKNSAVNLKNFEKESLSVEHVDCRWLYLEIPAYCFTTPFEGKTVPFSFVGAYVKGIEMDWITDKTDHGKISQDLLRKDSENNNYFSALHKKWLVEFDKMFSFYYRELEKDYSKATDHELKTKLEQVWELYTKKAIFPAMIDGFMFYADKKLHSLLNDYATEQKTDETPTTLFSTLAAPVDDSFLKEFEEDLARIAKEKGKNAGTLVKEHCKKYSYINSSYGDYKEYTETDALERIKEHAKPALSAKENKFAKKKLIKKYKFPKEALQLARLTELFTKWQDERKQLTLTHIGIEAKIISEIGKRKAIEEDLLKACHYSELYDILDGKPVPSSAIKRTKEPTMAIFEKGKLTLEISGKEAVDFVSKAKGSYDQNASQISGLVAYPGKVTGKAKIVRTFEDTKKVEIGDVLVIPMTRPEHTPIMKKAIAIVTDDGGITCHAAIIARELKKVCIIGTKHATQIIKDGDIVEVDADKGIVKILKSKP